MTATKNLLKDRYGYDFPITEGINQTINTILSHGTCRKYTNQSISDDLLNLLLACAQSAPSKSNLQQYSVLVVRNLEIRRKLAALVPTMNWVFSAPILLVFLGDVRRIRQLAKKRGYKYQNNNADTFMNASIDAALAMQSLITGAESLGLGVCPISYLRNHIGRLSTLLSLPDGVFPICGLTLGYKAEPGYISMRLPQDIVVHYDFYNDDDLDKKIKEFDDRNHERSPISPIKQRHVDKYGVLERCTWSENVCRQLSLPEREKFADYLNSKGIKLT